MQAYRATGKYQALIGSALYSRSAELMMFLNQQEAEVPVALIILMKAELAVVAKSSSNTKVAKAAFFIARPF